MNKKYRGMTINERLFESGLFNKFELVICQKKIGEIKSILRAVEIYNEKWINDILENFNSIPKKDDEL